MPIHYRAATDGPELYYADAPLKTHGLIVLRDSSGAGGWSLHTAEQIAGDGSDYLLSGDADLIEAAGVYAHHNRPNQADYDAAASKR